MTVTQLRASNKSGIQPKGNRVLIKPDEIEEYTEGGIYLPEQDRKRHESAACYGYVIAIGEDAWTHSHKRIYHGGDLVETIIEGYSGSFAKVGDRISFAPYVGLDSVGEDGVHYKTINDEDVLAIVTKNVTQTSIEARKPLGVA